MDPTVAHSIKQKPYPQIFQRQPICSFTYCYVCLVSLFGQCLWDTLLTGPLVWCLGVSSGVEGIIECSLFPLGCAVLNVILSALTSGL